MWVSCIDGDDDTTASDDSDLRATTIPTHRSFLQRSLCASYELRSTELQSMAETYDEMHKTKCMNVGA